MKLVDKPSQTTGTAATPEKQGSKPYQPKALDIIGSPRSVRKIGRRVAFALIAVVIALYFVPWQQNIPGTGQVTVYDPMGRPQSVMSPIPGRIVSWEIREGDEVKKGDVIARIEDIDPKFLDKEQPRRLTQQRQFALMTQSATQQRVGRLQSQRSSVEQARQDSIQAAREAVRQAALRVSAARQSLSQAKERLKIAREAALLQAEERKNQALNKIAQAQQDLLAARQEETTRRLDYERMDALFKEGVRSGRDAQFAQNDYVKSQTNRVTAEQALQFAQRDLEVAKLAMKRVGFEVSIEASAVEKADADLNVAIREQTRAQLDLSREISQAAADLSKLDADVQGGLESLAKNSQDIQKVDVELANVNQRTNQQVIRAPADGQVTRLLAVGEGATVKAGDELAVIVPNARDDRIVELFISDNDVPLIDKGRLVRLQFAGWPALQFSGWPSVAVGSFGGRVIAIDQVDDGSARYRVLIERDIHRLAGGRIDEPWPDQSRLRPGAEVAGWIILDTVPLGFELWRVFNGFPPRVNAAPPLMQKSKSDPDKEKDPQLGPIKVKSKS